MENNISVRPAYEEEWQDAMGMAWLTFLKYDAKDYLPSGVRNFHDFITDEGLFQMFKRGQYQMFLVFENKQIVGVITLRNVNHISLLFVEKEHLRKGIGRKLNDYVHNYLLSEVGAESLTVNAAPHGVGFYHKLGFCDIAPETMKDGIIFTPMKLYL